MVGGSCLAPPADPALLPQALALACLVGEEPEELEGEGEGEGPLACQKRFSRLSDGALLLRVLRIM